MQIACEHGNIEVVKYLILVGADVTANAIQIASQNGHQEVAKYLESLCVSIDNDLIQIASNGQQQVQSYCVLL